MNFSKYSLIPALALVAAGCLEPEPTPLGPDVIGGTLPGDAIVRTIDDPDSLRLVPIAWEESLPLFEPEMLFCGFDSLTGFRAEPLWVFDMAPLTAAAGDLDEAFLKFYLPDPNFDLPEDGDNPDLGREVLARLWELPAEPPTDAPLASPLDLTGASQVPLLMGSGDDLAESLAPFPLEFATGEGYRLVPARVETWFAAEARVTLALEWVDPDDSGLGEKGMIRIYSRLSSPILGDSLTNAVIKVRFGVGEGLSTESVAEGQSLGREVMPDDPAVLLLGTGRDRRGHLSLVLPEDLRDPSLMIIRARLNLHPADSLLFGMSPRDRRDNLSSFGYPALEGGLTLSLIATSDDVSSNDGLLDGTVLIGDLPIFEEYPGDPDPNDGVDEQIELSKMAEPLELPLTRWVQDWVNGDVENNGLTLFLSGAGERPRQAAWHIDPASADSLRPSLEIIYLERPDFD